MREGGDEIVRIQARVPRKLRDRIDAQAVIDRRSREREMEVLVEEALAAREGAERTKRRESK